MTGSTVRLMRSASIAAFFHFAAAPAAGLGLAVVCAAQAQAQTDTTANVVLENQTMDNGEKGSFVFPRIEFNGTNLTRDEVAKLFTAGTPKEDAVAIVSKMTAARVAIPTAVLNGKDAKITLANIVMTNIDKGQVGQLTMGGVDGSFTTDDGQIAAIKSGGLQIDGANYSGMLQAVKDGELANGTSRFSKFVWQGLEINVPDKDVPAAAPGGNLIKFRLGSITIDATYDNDIPLKVAGSVANLLIEPPRSSDGAKQLASVGYDKLDLGFTFAGSYDPASKVYALSDLTLRGVDAGSLGLKAQLDGVEKVVLSGPQAARMIGLFGAGVAGVELRFVNAGLVEKSLNYFAKQQGKSPEALREEARGMATQVIPVMLGGDASSLRIAEAVSRFLADPKGLTITAKSKGGSLGFIELMSIRDPASLLAKADVQVTADGAPAAAPAPAAPAAPAARPPSPQASAGGIAGAAGAGAASQAAKPAAPAAMPTQRLTGLAAWNALVGNSISGKNEDGDPLTEYYMRNGTVKQLADDETATGKWTVRGEKVCFKYPDEDEDCYRITVDGDIATFSEDDGSGRRYQILRGNPKKL
ncbi:hypothetical protein PY365_26630 [Roseiarcaceae bacterium H3SJ34-1]|uniref:hypothetical protein n=1 Tax=Terripilifer ovatus TaxID=3032367 RepID=UPI003AB9B42E|nr:hypothetical protein [Roseiarcaceae bacterium H3SJ34-1]